MQIAKPYIASIAREFWKQTKLKPNPPYDIQGAVNLILPVDIVSLSELSVKKIEQWLEDRNITFSIGVDDRSLHGFILTFKGSGFIFIDGTDLENERRYTIAHEASHFILDYKIPRDKAIERHSVDIIEVLDGLREPSNEERIEGVLSAVSIKPYMHLLEKSGDGAFIDLRILDAENDADSLALELLAPAAKVIREAKQGKKKPVFAEYKDRCLAILMEKYELPGFISEEYASRIAYAVTGGSSILTKLGF